MEPKYECRFKCVECNKYLTHSNVFYNSGVCPFCGNESDMSIVKHKKEVGYWTNITFWQSLKGEEQKWIIKDDNVRA